MKSSLILLLQVFAIFHSMNSNGFVASTTFALKDHESVHSDNYYKIEILEEKIEQIKQNSRAECNSLKANYNYLESNYNQLQTNYKQLEEISKTLHLKFENYEHQRLNTDRKVRNLEKQVEGLTQKQNITPISFTAYATESQEYNAGTTIIFDGVLRNYGDAYYPELGVFQCPVDGYYLFSVTDVTFQSSNQDMQLAIVMGEEYLVSADSEARTGAAVEQSTALIVTFCPALTAVFVRCVEDGDILYGGGAAYSTFSGTLLYT